METSKKIKDVLRQYLRDNKLTITAFVEKSGIPRNSVASWLAGRTVPNTESARRLSNSLGIPIEEMAVLCVKKSDHKCLLTYVLECMSYVLGKNMVTMLNEADICFTSYMQWQYQKCSLSLLSMYRLSDAFNWEIPIIDRWTVSKVPDVIDTSIFLNTEKKDLPEELSVIDDAIAAGNFGKYIYKLMSRKRMSQSCLARTIGVSKELISSWIHDRILPSHEIIGKLAVAVDTPVEDIALVVVDINNHMYQLTYMLDILHYMVGVGLTEMFGKMYITPSSYYQWRTNRHRISLSNRNKLSEVFSWSPDLIKDLSNQLVSPIVDMELLKVAKESYIKYYI